MQKLKYIAILMFFVSSIHSISLDELIELSKNDNLLIQQELIKKEKKNNEIDTVKWFKNPKLSFGMMENMSSQQITQGIKFPTKTYWTRKVKEKSLSKSQAKVRLIKRNVELKLSLLYYNLAFIEKKIALQSEKIAYLRKLESVVKQKYIQGKTSQHHMIELKMKILLLQDKLTSLKKKDRLNLQVRINEIVDNKLKLSEIKTEDFSIKNSPNLKALFSASLENYPLFYLKNQNIEQKEALLKKEKQIHLPDLSFGIKRENNEMFNETNFSFMFGFSLPLQFKANQASINSKRSSLAKAKLEKRISENQVKRKLQELRNDYIDLKNKLELYEKSIVPLAQQNRKVAASSYENDIIDFKAYINTINDLIDKELEYYKFVRNFNQKIVEISNMTKSEEIK